jgi:hypothetical protein
MSSFVDYYRCQSCGHIWADPKATETGAETVDAKPGPRSEPSRAIEES